MKWNETTNQKKLNKNNSLKARIKTPDHINQVKQTLLHNSDKTETWGLKIERIWLDVELMFQIVGKQVSGFKSVFCSVHQLSYLPLSLSRPSLQDILCSFSHLAPLFHRIFVNSPPILGSQLLSLILHKIFCLSARLFVHCNINFGRCYKNVIYLV